MERETITAGEFRLRPFEEGDIPWVYEVSLDPLVQKYLQIPVPYHRSDAEFFVREMCVAGWDKGTRAEFVVETAVPDGGQATRLGRVGLGLNGSGAGEIGYWMDPAARGRGIATAAVRALCGWAFGTLGLGIVEWRAELGNQASRRVAEKAGFTVEAVLRQRLVHRGVRVDVWVGSMLPSELPPPA
ncbi:GNAT family protein [Actinoplanes sp. Pm04-4]|uniref:GNAT family protein n=1 Tax=Paractinoplanes pyxinae TaxID=2997416 RepID=A0ABT4B7Z7_9ACTN|nr:GNAT family protein [Actinoplanes pyxinae]MCY1141720.1 GNAT family protein [Actinoplanes pyxinae]